MNYYSFHIGDYASHTRHLSHLEDLAYRRLIDAYYLSEKPFVGSPADIAKEIGMMSEIEEVYYVLTKFFESTEYGYINKRCDEEIAKYHAKQEQAVKAGKASAEKRFNSRSTSVQPTNNQEPITNNQININKPKKVKKSLKTELPEDFCISESIKAWANKNGHTQLDKHFEYFVDAAKSNGYTYADWDAAFRKAISSNWAKVGQGIKTQDKPTIQWHQTLGGVMAKGKELGIEPKAGETEGQYRQRLIMAGA